MSKHNFRIDSVVHPHIYITTHNYPYVFNVRSIIRLNSLMTCRAVVQTPGRYGIRYNSAETRLLYYI